MKDRYRTVAGPVRTRMTERRSVFECRLQRVETEDSARAVIDSARSQGWDAGHHCSAFAVGPNREITRSSDDGEPSGTAGMPMLEVLLGADLSDVVAVVSRWFGGVLLGTGGLVRAYSGALRQAVDEAQVVERELRRTGELTVGPGEVGRVEHDLRARGVVVSAVDYRMDADGLVRVAVAAALDQVARVDASVAELTRGGPRVDWAGEEWVDIT